MIVTRFRFHSTGTFWWIEKMEKWIYFVSEWKPHTLHNGYNSRSPTPFNLLTLGSNLLSIFTAIRISAFHDFVNKTLPYSPTDISSLVAFFFNLSYTPIAELFLKDDSDYDNPQFPILTSSLLAIWRSQMPNSGSFYSNTYHFNFAFISEIELCWSFPISQVKHVFTQLYEFDL